MTDVSRGRTACTFIADLDIWMGVDGYWMSLKFNAPGRHTLTWKGKAGRFAQNVMYTLTAQP